MPKELNIDDQCLKFGKYFEDDWVILGVLRLLGIFGNRFNILIILVLNEGGRGCFATVL